MDNCLLVYNGFRLLHFLAKCREARVVVPFIVNVDWYLFLVNIRIIDALYNVNLEKSARKHCLGSMMVEIMEQQLLTRSFLHFSQFSF